MEPENAAHHHMILPLTLGPTSVTPCVLHHHGELQHLRLINHFGKVLMATWQEENQEMLCVANQTLPICLTAA